MLPNYDEWRRAEILRLWKEGETISYISLHFNLTTKKIIEIIKSA